MPRPFKRSPIALAVLVLLHEQPLHPYRMQRLIKDRNKDQVINVGQRASLYQTIGQLQRAGLIEPLEVSKPDNFPERTLYRLTSEGQQTAIAWLREMMSSPANEFPEFPAAISFLPLLSPDDALRQLEQRAARLEGKRAALDAELHAQTGDLPRLFLLESEYLRVVLDAELVWVRSVIADIRSGALTWNNDWMRPFSPPDENSTGEA